MKFRSLFRRSNTPAATCSAREAGPDNAETNNYFHGRGCCFTHADGTSIDVDFADDGTAFDFFFTNCLKSLPSAEWCERQLKRDEGWENAWQFDLVRVTDLNLIRRGWRGDR